MTTKTNKKLEELCKSIYKECVCAAQSSPAGISAFTPENNVTEKLTNPDKKATSFQDFICR